jgi:hypothetical protein
MIPANTYPVVRQPHGGHYTKVTSMYDILDRRAYSPYEQLGKADCLRGLAELDSVDGSPDAARAGFAAAHALYEQLGNDLGKAHCLCGLAELAEAVQDYGEACRLYAEAEALYLRASQLDWVQRIARKRRHLCCFDGCGACALRS